MTDWSQIVRQHGPVVWRTARRLLGNDTDAADCLQRTFISALELSRTDVVLNWAALLKRLAMARAIDCLRQRRRDAQRFFGLHAGAHVDDRTVAPLQAAAANELAEHLRQALAELDVQQAQVFCLACLEDCSYQDIAEQLGLTVNHVGVLLSRARANLRQRLEAYEPGSGAERSKGRFSHEQSR
jgi:RNA polymerase sigma-70 factor (ECF subfamily)